MKIIQIFVDSHSYNDERNYSRHRQTIRGLSDDGRLFILSSPTRDEVLFQKLNPLTQVWREIKTVFEVQK